MKAPETKSMEFDLAGVSVMLAIPVNRDFPWQTTQSLVETAIALKANRIEFDIQYVVGSSIVEVARSKVCDVFLKGNKSRLLMIDSDQAWKPEDVMRLLALSTRMSVVTGAYPAKKDPPTYLLAPEDGAVSSNEYGCLPLKGLGLGFTMVRRDVIQALADKAPRVIFPGSDEPIAHLFRCDTVNGLFRGEDIAFFEDVRALGHTVWVDPTINIGHVGSKEYRGRLMDALVEA